MRLALICDDYLPNSTRVSAKMMHELALELTRKGHEPIVITPADSFQKQKLSINKLDGVSIYRFRSGKLKDVSKIKRAFNESLLSIKAWDAIKEDIRDKRFDGIIYYSPSIFFGGLVCKLKKIWKCPSYLVLRDIFPQWVIDEGIIKENSFVAKFFRYHEKRNYIAADCIGLMSPKNLDIFASKEYSSSKLEVLYNWTTVDTPKKKSSGLIEKLDLSGKIIFLYGGNIGKAQDMLNLIRLAKSMQSYSNIHFLFIGQGDEYNLVQNFIAVNKLCNTTLLKSISQEQFSSLLTEVHVGLFSLSKKHKTHNFPGKLLGYMAHGLPILGSINAGNDLADVINGTNSGFVFDNGNDISLLAAAVELAENPSLRAIAGHNSKMLLINNFSVSSAANHILLKLNKLQCQHDIKNI